MKLSQKKTCNGCKAFDEHRGAGDNRCTLGIPIITERRSAAGIDYWLSKPSKPCLKPISYIDLIKAEKGVCYA